MSRPRIAALVAATQIVGITFFGVFMAAFYLPLPSNDTLIGDPNFRTPMSILGLIFIALIIVNIVLAYVVKRKD